MSLLNFGLILLIPALIILIGSIVMALPDLYREDDYLEDDCLDDEDDIKELNKLKWIYFLLKYSLLTLCLSSYIFALDFYFKEMYILTLFLILAPIWVLWDYYRD